MEVRKITIGRPEAASTDPSTQVTTWFRYVVSYQAIHYIIMSDR